MRMNAAIDMPIEISSIGLAIGDDDMAQSVEAVLDLTQTYRARRFSRQEVKSGIWPDGDFLAIVASAPALRSHRRAIEDRPEHASPIIVILKSSELSLNRDNILYSDSFVLYDHHIGRLPSLIRICGHKLAIMPDVADIVPGKINRKISILHNLPNRERLVLAELSRGIGNRQIADHLNLTVSRVKDYVRNILGQLGFRNRTDAGVFAAAYMFDEQLPTTSSDDE